MIKRLMDIVGASLLALSTLPIVAVAAIFVRLRLGSPVLFRQVRAGRNGQPFAIVKLRTMLDAQDFDGRLLSDGERLTPLGRMLRAASIDELPTLWNVLAGDMSLVGPRPLHTSYVQRYDAVQRRRLDVRPGITGWAQINGRNSLSWEEKFAFDVWYVDNRSLLLDVQILLATAWSIARPHGISAEGEATMPEFKPGASDVQPGSSSNLYSRPSITLDTPPTGVGKESHE